MKLHRPEKIQHRVVITGVGAITPLGVTIQDTWRNALEGRSGISNITRFDTTLFDTKFAGEIKNFNPDNYIEKKEQKKMDYFIQYALAAAHDACHMSGITNFEKYGTRAGVLIGSGMGGLGGIEEQHSKLLEKGPGRVSPFFIPSVITNLAPGQVSMRFKAYGPNFTVTSACASGVHAVGEAVKYIRSGTCDIMIAGSSESTICPLGIAGFNAMKALSTRNEAPEKASRPWDKSRDGFVLSEGCAIFILESLEHAINRGAKILAEVTGYGASSDAYHITSPAEDGSGAARAMNMALEDATLKPSDIDYINAHGTSTPTGDGLEVKAIKNVFSDHAYKLHVSSTKSMTGHALGAAGAIETAMCLMTLQDQIMAPTINLDSPSEDCDLNFVPHLAVKKSIKHVLNNSFGFGGTNSCLILSKFENM